MSSYILVHENTSEWIGGQNTRGAITEKKPTEDRQRIRNRSEALWNAKDPSEIYQEKRKYRGALLTVTRRGRHAPLGRGVAVVPHLWLVGPAANWRRQCVYIIWRRVCAMYKPPMTNTRTRLLRTMRGSPGPAPPYQKILKKDKPLINPPSPREEASSSTCERRLNLIKRLVILIIPNWDPK